MRVWAVLPLALRELVRRPVRSGLTALGVIIGVAAVIAMVTLGQGATERITEEIAGLGHNLVFATPGAAAQTGPPTPARPFDTPDVEALAEQIEGVTVAPTTSRPVVAVHGNVSYTTGLVGTAVTWPEVRNWPVAEGRMFTEGEAAAGVPVCVLGTTVVRELRGPAVGEVIRLGNLACEVVGVLQEKGAAFGADQDDQVLIPLRAMQRRIVGEDAVDLVYLSAHRAEETGRVVEETERILRERRRIAEGDPDDFRVQDMGEIAATVETATGVLTAFLGAVAAVSLVVGGVGIMNIMLVSVTERTREIGLRLAIGARGGDVLQQFLVEAVVLALTGGLIGVSLGLLGAFVGSRLLAVPFVPDPWILLLAFAVSAAVGVGFGYAPARKAARLDPIEALRHE